MGPVGWHARLGARLLDHASPRAGRVGPITDYTPNGSGGSNVGQKSGSGAQLARLPAQQIECQRQAVGIARDYGFGAVAASAAPERMDKAPPFAPAAFWCARMLVPSMNTSAKST